MSSSCTGCTDARIDDEKQKVSHIRCRAVGYISNICTQAKSMCDTLKCTNVCSFSPARNCNCTARLTGASTRIHPGFANCTDNPEQSISRTMTKNCKQYNSVSTGDVVCGGVVSSNHNRWNCISL